MTTIRVAMPAHLRTLARVDGETTVEVADSPSMQVVLDALEDAHPALRGTIRDHHTGQRRAFMRYFACGQDISLESPQAPLPEAIVQGDEPVRLVGAIAGG